MSDTERDDLVRALAEAIAANNPLRLLGGPTERSVEITKAAIEACPSFEAIEGQYVFSANSLIPIHSDYLAMSVYYRGETAEEKADWLLHVMKTTVADGFFIAAIWGIRLTETIQLSPSARLIPVSQLRNSAVKRSLIARGDRAERTVTIVGDEYLWSVHRFTQVSELQSRL